VPEPAEIAAGAETSVPSSSATEDDNAEKTKEVEKSVLIEETKPDSSEAEPVKESDELPVMPGSFDAAPLGGEVEDLEDSKPVLKPESDEEDKPKAVEKESEKEGVE
jgi:hypothetical protein